MRLGKMVCTAVLVLVLALSACGRPDTGGSVLRATDYLEFTDYPEAGRHRTAIGVRELEDAGFFFRASTRAELDYSVGGDQLGEMTEALGGQLTQAYTWRLENRYPFDSVALTSEGMEQLLGGPAYHATFRMREGSTSSQSDFYCLTFDGMLCTLEFVFEDTRANRTRMSGIVKNVRLSETWGMPLPGYGNEWEADYRPPVYLPYSGEPLEEDGGRYRVDGKLYGFSGTGDATGSLQLYDHCGYFWNVTADDDLPAAAADQILERLGSASLEGIPVTVFGTLDTVQPPPDSGDPNTPLEAGFALTLRGRYLVTAEDAVVYALS